MDEYTNSEQPKNVQTSEPRGNVIIMTAIPPVKFMTAVKQTVSGWM